MNYSGQVIGGYKIGYVLGEGGMATVYEATHLMLRQRAAIKILNSEFTHHTNIRNRFLAEARTLYQLSHPNIVKVSDLIEEGDTVAFVMELIEGETLKSFLDRKGKLSDAIIESIFTQMLEAVRYVHSRQLVHRDIKPSNFMLDSAYRVTLMDFGIAKTLDQSDAEYTRTGTGMQLGTPMYMSPEQVKSSNSVSPASDFYSLGVVLWQMASGRSPYNSQKLSIPEIQVSILKDPLPITHTRWDAIIQRATRKEPEHRGIDMRQLETVVDTYTPQEQLPKNNNQKKQPGSAADIIIPAAIIIFIFILVFGFVKSCNNPKKKNTINNEVSIANNENLSPPQNEIMPVTDPVNKTADKTADQNTGNQSPETTADKNNTTPTTSEYPSVIIGKQEWMTENLNVDHFRNGDPIPEAQSNEAWKKAGENKQPAWCYYNNDPANGTKYGKLYNWYAVNDSRGLAPLGWHVPYISDWTELTNFLGGSEIAGLQLKSMIGWGIGNGNNKSGFNGLPGGYRKEDSYFDGILNVGNMWCSDCYKSGSIIEKRNDVDIMIVRPEDCSSFFMLTSNNNNLFEWRVRYLSCGLSVRCLR